MYILLLEKYNTIHSVFLTRKIVVQRIHWRAFYHGWIQMGFVVLISLSSGYVSLCFASILVILSNMHIFLWLLRLLPSNLQFFLLLLRYLWG